MDGREYRARLLLHAAKRGYGRPRRQGNDWIFEAASGAQAIVEFEPTLAEKSGYLTYAKIQLTAGQNDASGKWPERVASRLRTEHPDRPKQTPRASEEPRSDRRRVNRYPKIYLEDFDQYAECLPGENRSFGGNGLYPENIPRSSWFKNLRSMMPIHQWKVLTAYVRHRAGNKCEVCGSSNRLEAHERWKFDQQTNTQKLMRIMCVCKECHLAMHPGLASRLGIGGKIEEHIRSLTGLSTPELSSRLSADAVTGCVTDWHLDVSIAEAAGVTVFDPTRTAAVKERQLAREAERLSIEAEDMPGGRLDLSAEIRQGMVATLAYSDGDVLGCVMLADTVPYVGRMPDKLRPGTISIPLGLFVKAHNNPVVVWNERDLGDILKSRSSPRRLIVRSSWVREALVRDCLKDAILFSFR